MTSRVLKVAILTISDRVAAGEYEDRSGPALAELAQQRLGAEVLERDVVPDDRGQIAQRLSAWADEARIDLILTTGGTGFAPRDVTPEATADVIERAAPGLDEAMRAASRQITPHGMLSRGNSGIRGRTLILNLPGSPKGATESFIVVASAIRHAVALLREEPTDHTAHHFHQQRPII